MDRVTQLQLQLEELTTQMYTYVGILQRDAPPAPLVVFNPEEAAAMQQRLREFNEHAGTLGVQFVETAKGVETIIKSLPGVGQSEEQQLEKLKELEKENRVTGVDVEQTVETAGLSLFMLLCCKFVSPVYLWVCFRLLKAVVMSNRRCLVKSICGVL